MTDPLFDVTGKVALVTGATSGIGRACALALAQRGATVVATGRRGAELDRLAREAPGIFPHVCDLRVDAARAELFERIDAMWGGPDVVLNAAGATSVRAAIDTELDVFLDALALNVGTLFAVSTESARRMSVRGGGSIINVASIYGHVASGSVTQSPYVASKGAVVALTRQLAAEWARHSVRVNALCPGWVETEMTSGMSETERGRTWIERRTILGRLATTDDLIGPLLLLASDAGSYMTGTSLMVDGGYCAL